jgi:HEPN superfamily protein
MSTATLTRHAGVTRSSSIRPAVSGRAPSAAVRLLLAAHQTLADAEATTDSAERYASAHLGALRAAAAVLADRTEAAGQKPRRPTSAWTLLVAAAPEMTPWATFFASGAGKRAAAEAGLRGAVTDAEADDLVRDAQAFIAVVETTLGMLSLGSAADTAAMAARHSRQ